MTCIACGATMKTRTENHRYDACGLPGITLVGVQVSRCASCGEFEVRIPRVDELHRTIAGVILKKASRLTPAEIRFLRKYLGWSGADFAAHAGVTPETVSRWEQGAMPMGATAERFLRLCVATREPVKDYSLGTLKEIAEGEPPPLRLRLQPGRQRWRIRAA